MKTKWKNFQVGILGIGILASAMTLPTAGVYAAENNDSFEKLADTADAQEPVTSKPVVSAQYHKDFQYSNDVVLRGIYGTNSYYFQVPDYWDTEYVYASVQVSLSSLIQNVPASLTFSLNNTPITSFKMDYQNGKEQIFYVEIPVELLKEGYNSFDITGYARVYDDDGCIDDLSGANWISISKNSFIQCGYSLKDSNEKISAYPYPFFSTADETGSDTYIAVSDEMNEQELEAALMLRADLGNEIQEDDRLSLVKESDLPASLKNGNVILVSLWENLSGTWKKYVEEKIAGQDLQTQAVIRNIKDENGNHVLILTSENSSCLAEAASMLMDEKRAAQEKSDTAFVKEGSGTLAKEKAEDAASESGKYTLAQLNGGGLSFVGPFHQESVVYLPFSGGYVLANAGKVDLQFRYSENLDFDRSMVTVYWGDIPVASKKLTKENAGSDSLSFSMPDDAVGTYASNIKVVFDLELPDLFCTPRMDQMPWAYVTEDSAFYLPGGQKESYSFSDRPYPFEVSSMFDKLLVVIPDEITKTELNTLGLVAARYGENLSPYAELEVKTASEAEGMDKKEYNMIVIGNGTDNKLLQSINDKLYFQYTEDGKAFQSNEYFVFSDFYASSVGTLQLMNSPYGEGQALLAVAALDDPTMAKLADCLSENEMLAKLEKDTVLADTDGEISTFQIGEKSGMKTEPILKKVFKEQKETAVFVLVSVGVMLLLLLAAILILIRSYMHGRRS